MASRSLSNIEHLIAKAFTASRNTSNIDILRAT